jgi:CHAT domain-containing protein/tetratricopeptide (TPR) repeat protein
MKIYLTILSIFWTILAFAQVPTGDLEKDTALANQYFETIDLSDIEDFKQTKIKLEKTIELYEAHPFDPKLIELKGAYVFYTKDSIEYDSSYFLTQRVIKLAEEEGLPEIHPSLKFAFLNMYSLLKKEQAGAAIEYGKKALECTEIKSNDYFEVAEILLKFYTANNHITEADTIINTLEKALNELQDKVSPLHQLMFYRGKMQYSMLTGNHEKSIIYGQKLLAENKLHEKYNSKELSEIYAEIGRSHSGLSQFEKANEWINKGLNLAKIEFGDTNPKVGIFHFHLAIIHKSKGNLENAVHHYQEAIRFFLNDKVDEYKHITRVSYSNLAAVYQKMGDLNEAEKSIRTSQKYGKYFGSSLTLGNILGLQGKNKEAVEIIHNEVIIVLSTHFDNPNTALNPSPYELYTNKYIAGYALMSKAVFMLGLGKKEKDVALMKKSIESCLLALNIFEQMTKETRGFEQSSLYNTYEVSYALTSITRAYYDIYELAPSEAIFNVMLKFVEKQKSIQLLKTLSLSSLPKDIYLEEQKLSKSIQLNGQQLDLMTARNEADSILYYQNALFDVSQQMELLVKKINQNHPKEADNFYPSKYPVFKNIQKELSDKTLLIEYSKYNNVHYIMVMSAMDKNVYKVENKGLKAKVERLNQLIQSPVSFQKIIRDEFIDVSHELYKTLIQPIESELEGKTKIMIVLEGQLFHLPFELLLKSNEKKPYHELDFLIKKYEINYHYSATAFLKLQEKKTVKDNSLLAFAPIFSKGDELTTASRSLDFMVDSVYRSIENFEFIALPSTKKEVRAIAKLVKSNDGKANVLLSKNATKNKLATELESQPYQFIHIATHGLVNFKNPKLSALACYSKNEKMDNLFYANEIQFKNINADLVVLSSCESGIGKLVAGEGLIALNRSFIYSGAKNVLFSLWKVSDKYSSELMIDFYKNYFQNPSYTSALRHAKLKMLSDPTSAQPKYWSAFILMGQ